MKVLHRLFVSTLFLLLFSVGLAEPLNVFFGTGGRGAEGIYQATFNPDNGKFSPAKLAAKIGSPGFLTLHPNGKILYSVGRWEGGTGAIGYQVTGGELKEFTRMACPDGGGCHIAFILLESFSSPPSTEAGRLLSSRSIRPANWANPP